jgi:hypothetical protein
MGQLVSEKELTVPSGSTRVWADDVNGDGKLDILVGDNITLVSLAKGVSKDDYADKLKKWKAAQSAASKAMGEAKNDTDREAAQKRMSAIYQERTEFMNEERTGYVWLYLRK